jgi:hypothetical protein
VGTSFAAPKVTHIAAALQAAFPQESTLLYRALIVQSARLPAWTNSLDANRLYHAIRTMGYGIPDINRALGNSPNRVTLTTRGLEHIQARQAKVYQVKVPEDFLRQGEGFDVLIEITLSYVAEPRRTRRNRRKYLSTWLDWTCSKRGEDPARFLDRVLKDFNAVVGHTGWNQDTNAEVPFALAVSFEAINSDIDVYTSFVKAEIKAAEAQAQARAQQKIQLQQLV